MKKIVALMAVGFALVFAVPASANLIGDKDCFGLGGTCPDGTLWRDGLGGVFFTDYRSPSDILNAPFTDIWFSDQAITYMHTGTAGSAATLTLRIAGVADNRGPWDVYGDGFLLGQIPVNTDTNNFQEVLTYTFFVPASLMADGQLNVLLNINIPTINDGYSIDFSELTSRAPEPMSLALVGLGLAMMGFARRRTR